MPALAVDGRELAYEVAGDGPAVVLVRALLGHVGIERASFVGSSIGGRIALEYALEHPEVVEKLVLVAPAVGGHEWSAEAQRADDEETARFEAGDFDAAR